MHYTCQQPVKGAILGASINMLEGTAVWGLHGLNVDSVPKTLRPGSGYADLKIPQTMLRPDEYLIFAAVQPLHLTSTVDTSQKRKRSGMVSGPRMESRGLIALGTCFTAAESPTTVTDYHVQR